MTKVELFSANVCPFAQRVRLALLEKRIDFDLIEIDLSNKPVWFSGVSPYGKVPVLRHDGHCIYESAIINEYLEEVFPKPSLFPLIPVVRAQARIWIDYCNQQFIPVFYQLLRAKDKVDQGSLSLKLKDILIYMETEGISKSQVQGPYWFGENFTLADISFYPFFERMIILEHYRNFYIPDECPILHSWYQKAQQRQSAISTRNSAEYFIKHYAKYAA